MIFHHIKVGEHRTNCYIFGDSSTNEAAVVDPGYEGEKIFNIIKENGYKVKYIILTHGHFDHIGEVDYIKKLTGAETLIHKIDAEMLTNPHKNFSIYARIEGPVALEAADRLADDGDVFDLGKLTFKIIHTPGHTMGGICILCEDKLFSGDTLFKETVGRTDLPHSSHSHILKSIEKLMLLDDNIEVFPGHGDSSTIGHEKKYNPFVGKNV